MRVDIYTHCGLSLNESAAREFIRTHSERLQTCSALNLRGCVFNYPAIGLITDAILDQSPISVRSLTIEVDFRFDEEELAMLLFVGSNALDLPIQSTRWHPTEVLQRMIRSLTQRHQSITVIRFEPRTQTEVWRKQYGTL
jgi:hypothetical protein